MNRHEEINLKHDRVRQLLAARGADALLLRRTRNVSWFTAGADPSIAVDGDFGAYTVLVSSAKRTIVTDNIEATRLHAEEDFESLGFDYLESPWYAREPVQTPTMIVDEGDIDGALQAMRINLVESEQARLRALGADAAAAVEEAARAVRPGDTEYEIAARLDAACRQRGGMAIVNLIATDERISQYRHPYATAKRLERYAMVVVCMRRHGLIVSATRLAHVGTVPDELREKLRRVAAVDATAIAATRPGRTLGEVFADIQDAYAAQGETGQWTLHHQGGSAGYAARERVATPGDPTPVEAGQAFAWNPSIVGCKSEDTILVKTDGFEIVTSAAGGWPTVEIEVNGMRVPRSDILEV